VTKEKEAMKRTRVLIMGAAGRDFHNFNVVFRDNPQYEVIAFTAAQIPNIEGRRYPPELAGALYPEGVPIYPEEELERLIEQYAIDQVVFSYSDVSHEHVMQRASRVLAHGADFRLLGPRATMLRAHRPVISVCAVRTGCGKSPTSRKIARLLREMGRRVVVVRHPMPYGDLSQQIVERFETLEDLHRHKCTIEEMEEYEPHLRNGVIVYAGVDYARILHQAEAEADILLWDGGNNDLPFFVPDLEIVLVDPHRPGHERTYFPGEVNFLRADVLIISKVNTARLDDVEAIRRNIRALNPKAIIIEAALPIVVDAPEALRGRRVLVVEDGPTLTHGEMSYGAGVLAAHQWGARELVDPRPYAVGSIRETFAEYPHIGPLLPAMGYGSQQMRELEETINRVPCDVVLVATPVDLRRVLQIRHPTCRVSYELEEIGSPTLADVLSDFLDRMKAATE
jgi:predicted GTPase